MKSNEPTLYLYSRVSSDKQTHDGKIGIARQTGEGADRAKKRYPDMPVYEMSDLAMSGYKGQNLSKGLLGEFIGLCKSGDIAKGSVLAMEALDRFTRIALTKATDNVNAVLGADVIIYLFNDDSPLVRDDPMSQMKLTMYLQGANDYSKIMSHRNSDNATERRKEVEAGVRDSDGYIRAIGGYASHVWWVDISSGYVRPHPVYWDSAKKIVELLKKGLGHQKIREYLTDNGYKAPRKNRNEEYVWGQSLITKFHLDNQILGERTVTIYGIEHTHKNYYPPLVTEEEYHQISKLKSENRTGLGATKKNIGLLTGIGKLRCGSCDRTFSSFLSKSKTPYETQRYKCGGKDDPSIKCQSCTIEGKIIECAIIKLVGIFVTQKPKIDNTKKLFEIERKIKDAQKSFNLLDAQLITVSNSEVLQTLVKKLENISESKASLESERAALKRIPAADKFSIFSIPPEILNYKNTDIRKEFRDKIYSHVKEIKLKISSKFVDINIEFYAGFTIKASIIKNKYIVMSDETLFTIAHNLSDNHDEQSKHYNISINEEMSDELKVLLNNEVRNHEVVEMLSQRNDGASAMAAAEEWYGIDRRNKKVTLFNSDTSTSEKLIKLEEELKIIEERIKGGESLYI